MKKIALTFLIISSLVHEAKSQNVLPDTLPGMRKEFYFSITNFSPLSIDLKYKKQIAPKTYFKIGLVALSANIVNSKNSVNAFPVNTQNYSVGFEAGWERRRSITKKLTFFHGPSFRVVYYYNQTKDMNPAIPSYQQKVSSNNINGSIPYALGLLFQVHSNFYVAGEIDPSVYCNYQYNSNQVNGFHSFSGGVGFDNRYGVLSLVYRY